MGGEGAGAGVSGFLYYESKFIGGGGGRGLE